MKQLKDLMQRAAQALEYETEAQVSERLIESKVDPDTTFLAVQAGKILAKDRLLGTWGWWIPDIIEQDLPSIIEFNSTVIVSKVFILLV